MALPSKPEWNDDQDDDRDSHWDFGDGDPDGDDSQPDDDTDPWDDWDGLDDDPPHVVPVDGTCGPWEFGWYLGQVKLNTEVGIAEDAGTVAAVSWSGLDSFGLRMLRRRGYLPKSPDWDKANQAAEDGYRTAAQQYLKEVADEGPGR